MVLGQGSSRLTDLGGGSSHDVVVGAGYDVVVGKVVGKVVEVV